MAELRDLSGDERSEYFRGIQAIWGGGLEEGRFQLFQRRLADASEAADRYRVLGWIEGGELLSAMKAYDLQGSCARRELRVFGIGAVFTPPPLRRKGHAAAMLRAAMEQYRQRGAQAAVLFSDIEVEYYQRLGFQLVESQECCVDSGALQGAAAKGANGFRPAQAGDERQMSEIFEASRLDETRFTLARDGWTLRFQLRRLRELARARGVGEPEWGVIVEGEAAAMIRFGRESVDVLEAAWSSDRSRARLFAGLRDCMHRSGRRRLRVWPAARLRGVFPAQARSSALAMIAPLDGSAPLPGPGGPAELALLDHI